jgi:transcriptional regulator with XRE-family HTH domain
MDWIALRKALVELRAKTLLKRATFGRLAGINRHTVSRVEAIEAAPDYIPDASTVEAWLRACGSTENYSEFVGRIGLPNDRKMTDDAGFLDRGAQYGGASSASVPRLSFADRRQIESLAWALLRSIDHPLAVLATPDSQDEEPGSGEKGA